MRKARKVVAHLAPGDQRPHLAPEPQAERPDVARGAAAGLVRIVDGQHLALFDRALDQVDRLAGGVADHPHRRVDLGAGDAVLFGVGQHGADLDQRLVGGACHGGAAKGAHHARAGNQRHDLVTREHQRRKVETLPHHVANAGLAVDRHPGRLQVGDVAIDGSLGNLEPRAELLGGDQTATTQMLHDLKEPVGAAHRMVPQCCFHACRGPKTGATFLGGMHYGFSPSRLRCAATNSAPKDNFFVVGVFASSTRQKGAMSLSAMPRSRSSMAASATVRK